VLVVSTAMLGASVSETAARGPSMTLPELMATAPLDPAYGRAPMSEFKEPAIPGGAMFPDASSPSLFTPLLMQERDGADDSAETDQPQRLTTCIGVVLLAGGLLLYVKSPTFRNWLNQLIFDAFSPLKYE
jgi:hypothetical protein